MKGFFKWFNNGTKIKRWIFLIILGIACACFGISKLMIEEQLNFEDLAKIIVSFVLGFTCVTVGLIYIQKRTLEILVQETDTRKRSKKQPNVKSLIFNKKVYDEGPNIVVIGSGKGLNAVLRGIKSYTNNITAIVTVSDYGEEATESRKELGLLPLGDIESSIIALSSNETVAKQLFEHKFQEGRLKDLCFTDIYVSAMKEIFGDTSLAIEQSKNVLGMSGKVLPVTLEPMEICAELEDGTVIEKRNRIPEVVLEKASPINRIFVRPTNCLPAPGVIEAIQNADAIIIGPGSLYTNVIPNLLIKGVAKAIKDNKGFKIYVSNIMTEPGQTEDYSISEHIKAIEEHTGKGVIDYCIYDTGEIIPEFVRRYNKDSAEPVEQDTAKVKELGIKLVQRKLAVVEEKKIRHNADAVGLAIIEIICEDLKFRDMQNDAKYVLLDTRAKKTKKILKEASVKLPKRMKEKKEKGKKESKFTEKYKNRITSIKESEEKEAEETNK